MYSKRDLLRRKPLLCTGALVHTSSDPVPVDCPAVLFQIFDQDGSNIIGESPFRSCAFIHDSLMFVHALKRLFPWKWPFLWDHIRPDDVSLP